MLTVKTELKPDSFGGIGLFAAQDIPQGTVVWVWHDGVDCVYTEAEYEALPEPFKSFVNKHGYPHPDGGVILGTDNDRHINHSDEPNLVELKYAIVTAVRDIRAGEELTTNYRHFDPEGRLCASFLKKAGQ